MNENIITFNLQDNFMQNISDYIEKRFINQSVDLSRTAIVFEGKRPSIFLNRVLSNKINNSFFSPKYFSIEEFIKYTLSKKMHYSQISDMESCYTLYSVAKDIAPNVIKGRNNFSQFLSWAREINKFINLLDLEDISHDTLKNIQASAGIGYEIPENINLLLKNIILIRDTYHKILKSKKTLSKGLIYLLASEHIDDIDFSEFDHILFCGLFYMQKTERKILKTLYDSRKAIFFFQGDSNKWPTLKENSSIFSSPIKSDKEEKSNHPIKLYSAYDKHSQACTVREILKTTDNLNSTVIVLPDSNSIIPLISEIGSSVENFNISLGYPLKRSSLYNLFELIFQAQKTRKNTEYYAKDYLAALSQPIIKNLKLHPSYRTTRILIHKIEEALLGMETTRISGSSFIKLKDIEKDNTISDISLRTLKSMDIDIKNNDLQNIIKDLHYYVFNLWENITNFYDFSCALGKFLNLLAKKSFIAHYPLNTKIAERIYSIRDELLNSSFTKETFQKEDIFKIFKNMLENEMISFKGSPLKGLQILGTLETRSLNFDNVVIMDLNESAFPKIRTTEPLIPHEAIMNFGLNIMEKEEEIQKYLFNRLLYSAKNLYLIYEETKDKEKSRFIEELLWNIQKKKNNLNVLQPVNVNFSVNMLPAKTEIKKTPDMIKFLNNLTYSASSINTYIKCPLQFYYKYILGLKEKEELLGDPEAREIGLFIHNLLEKAFSRFINKKPKINQKFEKEFFKMFETWFEKAFSKRMRSDSFLLKNVIHYRLEQFLQNEKDNEERNVKEILYLEKKFNEKLVLKDRTFKFTYIVDRVDKLEDDSILILDYKTGIDISKPQSASQLEKMPLKREAIRDKIRSFQLPLYYYFEKKKYKNTNLNTAIYSLRTPKLTYLSTKENDLEGIVETCMKTLDFILHEIIDPETPINPDLQDEMTCKYCPFFYLCR